MNLLDLLMAALAASSDKVPLCVGESLCNFDHCERLYPICAKVPRMSVLFNVANGSYFQAISDGRVFWKAPWTRESSQSERWATEPRTDDRLCQHPDCRVVPYKAAKSVYDEFRSLGESSPDNTTFVFSLARKADEDDKHDEL